MTDVMFDIKAKEKIAFNTERFLAQILGKKAIYGRISKEEAIKIGIEQSREVIKKAIDQRILEELSSSNNESRTLDQINWLEETVYPHFKLDYISRIFNNEYPAPLRVQVNPSERCNQNCTHCINAEFRNKDKRDIKEKDLPYDILVNLPEHLSKLGVKTYSISGGGEPLMNKASIPSLVKAKELGMRTKLVSNGILFGKYKKEIAKYVDHIRISLDAADAETSHKIHKTRHFDDILKNTKEIIEESEKIGKKIKAILSYEIQPLNINGLEKFVEIGSELGVTRVLFEVPYDIDSVKMPKEKLKDIYKRLKAIKKKYGNYPQIYFREEQFTGKREASQNFEKCYTLFPKITIAANGNVSPCCRLAHQGGIEYPDLMIGSINDKTSIEKVLKSENIKKAVEKIVPSRCPSCIPSEYDINVVLNELADAIDFKNLKYRATDFFRLPKLEGEKETAFGKELNDMFRENYSKTSRLYNDIISKDIKGASLRRKIAELKESEAKLRDIYPLWNKTFY